MTGLGEESLQQVISAWQHKLHGTHNMKRQGGQGDEQMTPITTGTDSNTICFSESRLFSSEDDTLTCVDESQDLSLSLLGHGLCAHMELKHSLCWCADIEGCYNSGGDSSRSGRDYCRSII